MESFSMKCFLLCFTIISLQINGLYGCFRNERLALLDFKASVRVVRGDIADLLMPSWTRLAKNGDCCKWERVKCNSTTGRVNMLFLDSVGPNYDDMSRWYPNISIFYPLTQLHTLNLSYNAIAGFVGVKDSKSFNLNKLETLDLRVNRVDKSVLKSLGQFKSLRSLYLQSNRITGPISDQGLCKLQKLEELDLSLNSIQGSIPPCLGKLSELTALSASHNQLTGSIPKILSNLSKIRSLDLSHNSLSGNIPQELTVLRFLKFFSVAYNKLSGRIPNIKPRYGKFDKSSYEGNPLLCGVPLIKSCK